jgi:hypothetical protein
MKFELLKFNDNEKKYKDYNFVRQEDYAYNLTDKIPLYNGCSAKLCACMGLCTNVIGHVTREEVDKYKIKITKTFKK